MIFRAAAISREAELPAGGTLFHARDNATIELIESEPGRFAGLDHSSGHRFAVTVNGQISLVKDMIAGRSRRYAL